MQHMAYVTPIEAKSLKSLNAVPSAGEERMHCCGARAWRTIESAPRDGTTVWLAQPSSPWARRLMVEPVNIVWCPDA